MTLVENDGVQTVSLTVPAGPEYLALCRLALHGAATCTTLDAAGLHELKLALTEACTNSIVHGYAGQPGLIEVFLTVDDNRLMVTVQDAGVGFWATGEPTSGRVEGGVGLTLISELADGFEIGLGTDGRGTRITFAKLLQAGAGTDGLLRSPGVP